MFQVLIICLEENYSLVATEDTEEFHVRPPVLVRRLLKTFFLSCFFFLSFQVYEYCKLDPACTKGSEEYQAAKCDVQFSFQGKLHKQCIRDVTPTVRPVFSTFSVFSIFFVQSSDEECNRFKKVKKINSFRDELKRKNLDEIVILDNRGKLKTACYTEDAGM